MHSIHREKQRRDGWAPERSCGSDASEFRFERFFQLADAIKLVHVVGEVRKARPYSAFLFDTGWPLTASVVLRPLPVMQTTVVSSSRDAAVGIEPSSATAVVTPAGRLGKDALGLSQLLHAGDDLEVRDVLGPAILWNAIMEAAAGPSAGFPMASERAIVLGLLRLYIVQFPASRRCEMGEQPVACAPKKRTGFVFDQAEFDQLVEGLADLADERTAGHGADDVVRAGFQPSCSAISYPTVFEPSA